MPIFGKRAPAAPYETPLTPQEEVAFRAWVGRLPPNLQSTADYDLRGAWKRNVQAAANGHLPDDWKKPNHPTFSRDSIYSNPASQGGDWVPQAGGGWVFVASPDNLKYRSAAELENYFRRAEPGSRVVLPQNNFFRRQP